MKTRLLVLLMISVCELPHAGDNRIRKDEGSTPVATYIRALPGMTPRRGPHKPVLAFFLRFVDFGCEVCLNNFLDFCDSLNSNASRYGARTIVMIFQRDDNKESYQLKTLKKWSRACNVNFPVYLAVPRVFEDFKIDYSTAVLLNESEVIELSAKIPLPVDTQKEFIAKLFHDGR